jgi:geranylgeranylglycerol-phosphate geranylgeranyltransferase
MIGLAVIVGQVVATSGKPDMLLLGEGFFTGFFICAYSMVTNDIYDVEIDAINQPNRPIPKGLISVKNAKLFSVLLLVLGMFFSALTLNFYAFLIAAAYSTLSWLYNSKVKKKGLAGNAIVSSSLAIPFIYGGVLYGIKGVNLLLLVMALTSMFAGMGREIVKGIADIKGDREKGIMSFAVLHGERRASKLASLFFFSSVFLSILPIALREANVFYTAGIILPDLIFIYLGVLSLRTIKPHDAIHVKNIALLGMFTGLVVFIGGAL